MSDLNKSSRASRNRHCRTIGESRCSGHCDTGYSAHVNESAVDGSSDALGSVAVISAVTNLSVSTNSCSGSDIEASRGFNCDRTRVVSVGLTTTMTDLSEAVFGRAIVTASGNRDISAFHNNAAVLVVGGRHHAVVDISRIRVCSKGRNSGCVVDRSHGCNAIEEKISVSVVGYRIRTDCERESPGFHASHADEVGCSSTIGSLCESRCCGTCHGNEAPMVTGKAKTTVTYHGKHPVRLERIGRITSCLNGDISISYSESCVD